MRLLDERNNKIFKVIIFKDCAPFIDCIDEMNNTQIDNAKYIDVVMSMYNLIEESDNYSIIIMKFVAILQRWSKWLYNRV